MSRIRLLKQECLEKCSIIISNQCQHNVIHYSLIIFFLKWIMILNVVQHISPKHYTVVYARYANESWHLWKVSATVLYNYSSKIRWPTNRTTVQYAVWLCRWAMIIDYAVEQRYLFDEYSWAFQYNNSDMNFWQINIKFSDLLPPCLSVDIQLIINK